MVMRDDGADSSAQPPELLWNIKTVIAKTGLSRASIHRYIKAGRFPARRHGGPNRVAWVPADVVACFEGCPRLGQHHDRPNDDRGTERHQEVARALSEGSEVSP